MASEKAENRLSIDFKITNMSESLRAKGAREGMSLQEFYDLGLMDNGFTIDGVYYPGKKKAQPQENQDSKDNQE